MFQSQFQTTDRLQILYLLEGWRDASAVKRVHCSFFNNFVFILCLFVFCLFAYMPVHYCVPEELIGAWNLTPAPEESDTSGLCKPMQARAHK